MKVFNPNMADGGVPIKMFTDGVPVEDEAYLQLEETARLPFIHKHIAVMPDVHWGLGATIGSVVPTRGAIIPAAVGVDIGCGMMALKTDITSDDALARADMFRFAIEAAVPHGRTDNGGANDEGSHRGVVPDDVASAWFKHLARGYYEVLDGSPNVKHHRPQAQLGTLGGGNHFIEICIDESGGVWVMLHSGSRGPGNVIGTKFITEARELCERYYCAPPNRDLAWLPEGSPEFGRYMKALHWAQKYARINREVMMSRTILALAGVIGWVEVTQNAVQCHHNYVAREYHFGEEVWVTRKGAVRAAAGDLGIIPGSMGARSFIVRGKGNRDSFNSCSHGAGRIMSRRKARETFSLDDHKQDTMGISCRKDEGVLDETPRAYKDIEAVMAAQADLVDVVHTLEQIVCVKG